MNYSGMRAWLFGFTWLMLYLSIFTPWFFVGVVLGYVASEWCYVQERKTLERQHNRATWR